MKKLYFLGGIIFTALLLIAVAAHAYIVQPGDTLGVIAEKEGVPLMDLLELNILNNPDVIHPGQYIETEYMTELCNGFPCGELLGGTVPRRPTEFKTNLAEQKTEAHTDTTLKVTSVTTKDSNTLDPAILGDTIVLSINSGASNSEVVLCTGLTTSTKTFTGCTFGYRFDNPTATSSANIKAHSPGEPVIISNTDTYLSQQYLTLDGDQTIAGDNTFSGDNTITGSWNWVAANPPFYLTHPTFTSNTSFIDKKYADDLAIAGAADASVTVKGIGELATGAEAAATAQIGTGDTTAALLLNADIATSTPQTTGNYVVISENDAKISQAFLDLSEEFTFTGSTTVANVFNIASTTDWQLAKVAFTGTMTLLNESGVFFNATDITGTEAETLTDGSNADSLHAHNYVGVASSTAKTYWNFTLPWLINSTIGDGVFWDIQGVSIGNTHLSNWLQWAHPSDVSNYIISVTTIFPGYQFNDSEALFAEFGVAASSTNSTEIGQGWGFADDTAPITNFYDTTGDAAVFQFASSTDTLYAKTTDAGVGTTLTEITGITITNMNTYRIEHDPGVDVKFYVNGALEAVHTTNLPNGATDIRFIMGSAGNTFYPWQITEPNFALEK